MIDLTITSGSVIQVNPDLIRFIEPGNASTTNTKIWFSETHSINVLENELQIKHALKLHAIEQKYINGAITRPQMEDTIKELNRLERLKEQ